jgi:hypothetical protein
MPKYVVERNLPTARSLTPKQLQTIAQQFCDALQEMGPQIEWVESYVTADKFYCVYLAPSIEAIREHGRRGDFPVNRVSEVLFEMDPATAEAGNRQRAA